MIPIPVLHFLKIIASIMAFNLKVAIVHDSLTQLGGAERVVEALHEMFPQAPVFVLVMDKKLEEKFFGWDIRTSWLQVVYNIIPKFQWLFPLIPLALYSFNFSGYDLVISSSSSFAKNVHVPKGTPHINYCHTPTRFLWTDQNYLEQELTGFLKLFRPLARVILKWMKGWDYKRAQAVTHFIANSKEVQKRILAYYNRTSVVIYPFVDTNFWHPVGEKSNYFLLAGRLQPHKRNEFIIEIFNSLGLPLHVAGTGRQENYLKALAKSNITFLGRISDVELRKEYSGAVGFIYPQLEDFGLMPLEAAACGTATLAFGRGGSLETVIPGVTGELFYEYSREIVSDKIENWNASRYGADNLRQHAEQFSEDKFKTAIAAEVDKIVN